MDLSDQTLLFIGICGQSFASGKRFSAPRFACSTHAPHRTAVGFTHRDSGAPPRRRCAAVVGCELYRRWGESKGVQLGRRSLEPGGAARMWGGPGCGEVSRARSEVADSIGADGRSLRLPLIFYAPVVGTPRPAPPAVVECEARAGCGEVSGRANAWQFQQDMNVGRSGCRPPHSSLTNIVGGAVDHYLNR